MKRNTLSLCALTMAFAANMEAAPLPADSLASAETIVALADSIEVPPVDSLFVEEEIDFTDHWDNNKIHSYGHIDMSEIPDEVTLSLIDSLHRFCSPIVGYVRSRFMFRRRRPHKGRRCLCISHPH